MNTRDILAGLSKSTKKLDRRIIRKITLGDAWIQVGSMASKARPDLGVVEKIVYRADIAERTNYMVEIWEVWCRKDNPDGSGTYLDLWKRPRGPWTEEYDMDPKNKKD